MITKLYVALANTKVLSYHEKLKDIQQDDKDHIQISHL